MMGDINITTTLNLLIQYWKSVILTQTPVWVKMRDEKIWESAQKTLVAMEMGRNLNFGVISICKKVRRKLAVLSSSVSETV